MDKLRTIRIDVESEPHSANLEGVLLNRPAPRSGAFLIHQRIPQETWSKMREAGAVYWSADDLEDMDMFEQPEGWRYSLAALAVLIEHGYILDLRRETVESIDQLHAMFSDEGKATYRAMIEAERIEAERERERARQSRAQRIAEKGAAFEAWQDEHLSGLIQTTALRQQIDAGLEWESVTHFDRETPGTWYDTGNWYYKAEYDGETVWRCDYGNAVVYYAPQEIVDQWIRGYYWPWLVEKVCDGDTAMAAREVLSYYEYILRDSRVYGDDCPARLVELDGIDYYIEMAKTGEWFLGTAAPDYAARYNLPYTQVELVRPSYERRRYIDIEREFLPDVYLSALYRTPDSRLVSMRGNGRRVLTDKECAKVHVLLFHPPELDEYDQKALNAEEADLRRRRKTDLVNLAKEQGMSTSGTKEDLITRLLQAERQARKEEKIRQALRQIDA